MKSMIDRICNKFNKNHKSLTAEEWQFLINYTEGRAFRVFNIPTIYKGQSALVCYCVCLN